MYLKAVPFLIYGGDTLLDGTQCGKGTKRNCDHAVEFFKEHGERFFIILAASKRPDKPQYPFLNELMKVYLVERLRAEGFCSGSFLITQIRMVKEDAWSTFEESAMAAKEAKLLGAEEIYVCAPWYHLPRIMLIWRIINGWKMRIRRVSVPSPLRLKSLMWEVGGFARVLPRWRKWKKRQH